MRFDHFKRFYPLFLLAAAAPIFNLSPLYADEAVIPSGKGSPIALDGNDKGQVFDGVGMISAGGSSRLLFDYSDPYRSQILDYIFKPNYGASLQVFKVEIGSDGDSTDGAEASHMRTRDEENYHRGYEWWMMEQAKARQPEISLSALPWGAPAWVGNGTYWSDDLIDYIIKWLDHAQSDHHLTIDTVGSQNESSFNADWYKKFRAALKASGHDSIRVIGSDDCDWGIAPAMARDAQLNDAIDIIGIHTPHEATSFPPEVLASHKPLWATEDHYDHEPGCKEMARSLNRNYIDYKVTSAMFWPVVSALYDNLPYGNIGLVQCNEPWSGNYHLSPSLWVMAQTTQFTKPGWHYLDGACGYFDGDKSGKQGSYVGLAAPKNEDYSLIIETVDATAPRTAEFSIAHFPAKTLHVWSTDLNSQKSDDWFIRQPDITPDGGHFSVTLKPGSVYSITTTEGQAKGDATPPPAAYFPMPYADDFTGPVGSLGRYFSDLYGSFEIAPCTGGRTGNCLRQTTPAAPIPWHNKGGESPITILGDLGWTNYRVSCDVLLEKPGEIDILDRVREMSWKDCPNAYDLRVSDTGAWSILKSSAQDKKAVLTSGTIAALGVNTWHHIGLVCQGPNLTAEIDGKAVETISDPDYKQGMVALGVEKYIPAQFAKFRIDPLP